MNLTGYKNKSEFLKEINAEDNYDITTCYDLDRVGGIKVKAKITSVTKFVPKIIID